MKLLIILFSVLSMQLSGFAQDFSIDNLKQSLTVQNQQQNSSQFYIKNFSSKEKSIQIDIKRELLQGAEVWICFSGNCSDQALAIDVPPGKKSAEIEIHSRGGLSNITSSVSLEVKDLENNQTITREIFIEVTDQIDNHVFYSKDDVKIGDFYPNPAVKVASMEYSIGPYENDVKIILQNVLGSIVKEYKLDPRENIFRLPTDTMSPGVYFYTLFIKDEGLATRKLIVKK